MPVRPLLVALLAALPAVSCAGDASPGPLRVADPARADGSAGGVYGDTPLVDVAGDVVAPPPAPDWDRAPASAEPEAFSATRYELRAPASLASAFAALTDGDPTVRVLSMVMSPEADGLSVRYGAADVGRDGTLAWQEPDAPQSFRVAPAEGAADVLVSEPFRYGLRARIESGLSSTGVFTLAVDAEQAIFTATPSEDGSRLEAGALYGVVTRSEAASRPLALGALCPAVCGLASSACGGTGVRTLADVFDCTATPLDADLDGNGEADAYRLVIGFRAERAELSP